MKTAIETARDGITPLRVYHRTELYCWTHNPSPQARRECAACQGGVLPPKDTLNRMRAHNPNGAYS